MEPIDLADLRARTRSGSLATAVFAVEPSSRRSGCSAMGGSARTVARSSGSRRSPERRLTLVAERAGLSDPFTVAHPCSELIGSTSVIHVRVEQV